MHDGPSTSQQVDQASARELLAAVDAFFSDISYATNGTLLSFHDGAGVIPTATSTELAFQRWGNHTHGIGEGNMELPEGLSWRQLQQAGLVDRMNGLLRVDLVREIAERSTNALKQTN